MVSGARHAADRGLIDRNNVATFTEALTTNYMTHMRSPIVYRCEFQIFFFRFVHFPDALYDNGQIVTTVRYTATNSTVNRALQSGNPNVTLPDD